jgi:heterodisulfide reductase subunit B
MNYLYFPGCSLKSTGRAYEESLLETFTALGSPLSELEDWNCCGATAYMAVSELKAFALCARNFALAEKQSCQQPNCDLVVPCAACYLGLVKARKYMEEYPKTRAKVQKALGAAGLTYEGRANIRHPLDVLLKDIGTENIASKATRSLDGLRVACYYGCQLVRPYALFDDGHHPSTMDTLLQALGAKTVDWPLKTRCCGGSLTGTIQDVGLRLSQVILTEAIKRGANVVATACPLCQFNLECYQKEMSNRFHENVDIPVVYFTQLTGLALGLEPRRLGLHRLFMKFHLDQIAPIAKEAAHV